MAEQPTPEAPPRRGFLRSLGPAIIVASVVLGPGSILASSKVGCQFGYEMMWVLVLAGFLLVGMVALSARLGVVYERTACEELAHRVGRPAAALVGVTMFVVVAIFQTSNNLAVLLAVESLRGVTKGNESGFWNSAFTLLAINGFVITALYGLRSLYKGLERFMKLLVAVMIVGFAVNLFVAQPSLWKMAQGLAPSAPEEIRQGGWTPRLVAPKKDDAKKVFDPLEPVLGLLATTFSVAAALYQSYLVRAKGWTSSNLRQGRVDSAAGVTVLIGLSLMIMVTAAAVLHGRVSPESLNSAIDVSASLEPLCGRSAAVLFSLGIFAGTFSAFLINAMIGGLLLSDGLGLGGTIDGKWPKRLTVLALMFGMCVALHLRTTGAPLVPLIIFAQAITIIGFPVLAIAIVYLSTRPEAVAVSPIPLWLKIAGAAGVVMSLVLAVRTGWLVYLKLMV